MPTETPEPIQKTFDNLRQGATTNTADRAAATAAAMSVASQHHVAAGVRGAEAPQPGFLQKLIQRIRGK